MTDHIPAPAEHAPRKRTQLLSGDFIVEEKDNPQEAYILCDVEDTIPIRE